MLGRAWLVSHLRREGGALLGGSVVMISRAVVLLLSPWPLKYILDNVIFTRPLPHWLKDVIPQANDHRILLLNLFASALLLLGAADALLVYLGNRLFLNAGQRIVMQVRRELFGKLQRLPMEFHRSHQSGELMSRLSGDVKQLQDLVASIGIDILPHVLTIAGMIGVMLVIDWRYALLTLAVTPVLFFITRYFSSRLQEAVRMTRRCDGSLWAFAQEILGTVQLVQSFHRESYEDARFASKTQESLKAGLRATRLQSLYVPTMNAAIATATGLIVWYGALSVIHGRITPGELLVFLAYLRGIATPARQLAKTGRVLSRSTVAVERITEYVSEKPSITDRVDAVTPAVRASTLCFKKVSFAYRPGKALLRDIDFTLQRGSKMAIVGPTGSGKSTIASLASRFYDPINGSVCIDGRDLRDLSLDYVRNEVAVLLQEPVLFHATIWENIAYGKAGATRFDAIRAAKATGVDRLIERFPEGYDTVVSERGTSLSGGQRQCVAIARTMLSDASIVILDEPSSSLDAMTEQTLMRALATLTATRATIIIAHRLSTILSVDQILVLKHGRIVQRGSHCELMASDGAYSSLWQAFHADQPFVPLRMAHSQ